MEAIRRCLVSDQESEDRTIKTPDHEWDITINCDQETDTIIKLVSGGSICIRRTRELFKLVEFDYCKLWGMGQMQIKNLQDEIKYLEKENCHAWEYGKTQIEMLIGIRIKLDKQILEQLEIIRKYEESISAKQNGKKEDKRI